jgi:hypothetical protein
MSYKTFQIRRGTTADWTQTNPILAAGEMGWERDVPLVAGAIPDTGDTYTYGDASQGTGAIKIGDGVTRWLDLPYLLTSLQFSLPASSDVSVQDVKTGDLLRWSNGKWRNSPESAVTDGGNF